MQDASKHANGGSDDVINRVPIQGKLISESSMKNKMSCSKESSSSQHRQQSASDRRLVIIRPSTNSCNDDDGNDSNTASSHYDHEHEQWPLYHRLCRSYGFAVEVEQFLEPYKINEVAEKSPCRNEVGPHMNNLLLVDHKSCFAMGNFSARYGVVESGGEFVRLRRIGERLSVRLLARSSSMCVDKIRKSKGSTGSKRRTNNNANNAGPHPPPNLNDGDIIQTLDGKPDPTFAMLYGMMCRKEKLVLEVISAEASSNRPREKKKGDGQNDRSSTINAVLKARKQPATEGDIVTGNCTMNYVTDANNANPEKTYCTGSKKWNAAAAQNAKELFFSEDNEIENFVGETGATADAFYVVLTAPEEDTCARGNRNSYNIGSSTVTPAAKKARKLPITESGHDIAERARTHVPNTDNTNPGKINCAESKKWNGAAAQQAREQLLSEKTDTLHLDITAQGKTNNSGGNRIRNKVASSTIPVVVRTVRIQPDANGEQVIAETGATIDKHNADNVVPRNALSVGKRQEGVFTGAWSLSVADSRRGITTARDADDTTLDRTAFSWANRKRRDDCDTYSSKTPTTRSTGMNIDTGRELALDEIGATGDAIIAEKSSLESRRSDSDLKIEILPQEHGGCVSSVPIESATLSQKKLSSSPCGNDSNEMERIILSSTTSNRVPDGNDSAATINFQRHPDNPKLNTSNFQRVDRDKMVLDHPRMGSIALETSCKQVVASYDGGRMEDELFNMVEEELSRDQHLTIVCNDDRMTSSSVLRMVHVGDTPDFSPPPVDTAARTTEGGSKLISAGSHSALDVATTSTTGVNNQPLPTDEVGSVSSPLSPALFDCTGDDGNSVSSSSCSSSSSAKSMFMSSSSSSSSDSSNSSNKNYNNHAQPTIPTCKLRNDTHTSYAPTKPARKRPPSSIISIGSSTTISARSSTSLLQNNGGPTSLSRLWPDPSDIIKALTLWAPPVAQVRNNFHDGKQIVEFYGPIRRSESFLHGSVNGQSRYNPLLQSSNLSRNGEIRREFKNADEVMDALASTVSKLCGTSRCNILGPDLTFLCNSY